MQPTIHTKKITPTATAAIMTNTIVLVLFSSSFGYSSKFSSEFYSSLVKGSSLFKGSSSFSEFTSVGA